MAPMPEWIEPCALRLWGLPMDFDDDDDGYDDMAMMREVFEEGSLAVHRGSSYFSWTSSCNLAFKITRSCALARKLPWAWEQ